MEAKICQSCGMPMKTREEFGTNQDESLNQDYCVYCFKTGIFTADVTMDEMIVHCAEFVDEFNKESEVKFTKEQAIEQMKQYFPTLKRWKQN
ncbi:MAG: zinc ribbon domain-containing protein [Mangrovibacterium sp.]